MNLLIVLINIFSQLARIVSPNNISCLKLTCQLHVQPMAFMILCLFSSNCFADVPVFQHFGEKNGLENPYIRTIVEDELGYLWIGTGFGIFKFDGYKFHKLSINPIFDDIFVQDLLIGNNQELWIGTKNNGLLLYANNQIKTIQTTDLVKDSIKKIIKTTNNEIWVGTARGIFTVSKNNTLIRPRLKSIKDLETQNIIAIGSYKSDQLIISSKGGFTILDQQKDSANFIPLDHNQDIHDLLVDSNNNLWIACSDGLLKYSFQTNKFIKTPILNNATRILSLTQDKNDLWVASIDGGIFKMNILTHEFDQFTHRVDHSYSLLEKNNMTLFISRNKKLWVGGFSTGLNLLDLNSFKFGFETNIQDSIYCAPSPKIKGINVDSKGFVWIGNEYGLIKYHPIRQTCEQINLKRGPSGNNYTVYSINLDEEFVWVSTSLGLLRYNQGSEVVEVISTQQKFKSTFFSYLLSDKYMLVGTDAGLYQYDIRNQVFKLYESHKERYSNISFLKYATTNNNHIYFPTTAGILYLNELNVLTPLKNSLFTNKAISALQINADGDFFIGVKNEGLYHLNSKKELIKHYLDTEIFSSSNIILQIQTIKGSNTVWMASLKGIIYLNTTNSEKQLFVGHSEVNYLSLFNASFSHENKIYFAGNHGYVSFDPQKIDITYHQSSVLINQLYLQNKPVKFKAKDTGDFILNEAIEKTNHLKLDYKDNIFGFDFVTLDFNNYANIKYAYRLEPSFTHWVELLPDTRHLTFTNLRHGNYNLTLRSTNSDGKWSNNITNLKLSIAPPPWLTWWAYVGYILLVILGIYLYIRYKTLSQIKLTQYLKTQVQKQTQHIQKQKQTVEQLMARKDEIFSNFTHEFRTPITLIQGPITELTKKETDNSNLEMLEMVTRNSNRLLRLVNQMLKLSSVVDYVDKTTDQIETATKLKLIAEPYIYLAQKNDISFIIQPLDNVQICVTTDALELTIGNFLSNAFKYTQAKGEIKLGTCMIGNTIEIFVQDNGCGIDVQQQQQIFKRFGRLPQHQDIEGAGIGLALVKEIAELNHADINVISEVNKGSRFSIIFPIEKVAESMPHVENLNQSKNNNTTNHQKATVLIIEDNEDMRQYIKTILASQFNCIVAANGPAGIALALKIVPDIILSDVMMPGIDGFHVCRILRNDMITSHIPLVLLTALIEKASRIKGWRENIDMYLCKPFDAEELNLQLRNILNIRHILNNKNSALLRNDIYSEFSQIDEKFIRKLKGIIKQHYRLPLCNLEKMSELMFVSDRQLQRKTKALLNMSPIDLLREYRFKKAAQSLKNGYQVSVTSDKCGFSSVSYFSQSFTKRYGMSPKKYQNLKVDRGQ